MRESDEIRSYKNIIKWDFYIDNKFAVRAQQFLILA